MKQNVQIVLICVIVCILCSGCIIQSRQLESLGLATAVGFDEGKGGKIKGVTVLHHFGTRPEDVAQQLTSTAYTSKGIARFMNLETSDRLVTGQQRIAVFGKELARERGISELVETLKRDAATQTNMYLAISKTTAKDILYQEKEEEHSKNMGTYLYKMIRQNIEGDELISPTVQEFLRDYYQVGKDPVLPLLEKRRDFVLVDGAALMYKGNYVKHINAAKAFYVKALRSGFKGGGQLDVKVDFSHFKKFYPKKKQPKYMYVNLQHVEMKRKIKLVQQEDPVFDIDVKVTANITAMTEELDLGQPGIYEAFEAAINKEMKRQIEKTIQDLQGVKVDPVGFGAIYDTSIRHMKLTEKKWYNKLYPKAKFQVHVKTTITRSGVLN
ncbi:MAG: Ger(x)C family spore germination protein [Ectobacillus sp.]